MTVDHEQEPVKAFEHVGASVLHARHTDTQKAQSNSSSDKEERLGYLRDSPDQIMGHIGRMTSFMVK